MGGCAGPEIQIHRTSHNNIFERIFHFGRVCKHFEVTGKVVLHLQEAEEVHVLIRFRWSFFLKTGQLYTLQKMMWSSKAHVLTD